jgi:hypothetical protein
MVDNLVIRFDTKPLTDVLAQLRQPKVALARGLVRTGSTARTQWRRAIAADVGLVQRDVEAAMGVLKATPDRLVHRIVVTGRRIPLAKFDARGPEPSRGRGRLTYRIGRGPRRVLPGGFFATMPSGHRGVWKRQGAPREMTRGRYKGKRRQPIVERFGPSLPRVAMQPPITAAVRRTAEDAMAKNLAHEIRFLLSRQGGIRGDEGAA